MIHGYSPRGFNIDDNKVYGPCALLPPAILQWNVRTGFECSFSWGETCTMYWLLWLSDAMRNISGVLLLLFHCRRQLLFKGSENLCTCFYCSGFYLKCLSVCLSAGWWPWRHLRGERLTLPPAWTEDRYKQLSTSEYKNTHYVTGQSWPSPLSGQGNATDFASLSRDCFKAWALSLSLEYIYIYI